MIKKLTFSASLITLAACGEVQPIVSDFNGDSVKIQVTTLVYDENADSKADAEALRICRAGGRSRAERASSRALPNYVTEYLYLCLG